MTIWLASFIFNKSNPPAAAAKSLQSCPTLCNPIDGSPWGFPRTWDSPGKNTGVGCHFLLQWMKVKSESEVAQSCPTLSDPMDCSPLGSSIHGIFQARVLEWGAIAFSANPPRRAHMPEEMIWNWTSWGSFPWQADVTIQQRPPAPYPGFQF